MGSVVAGSDETPRLSWDQRYAELLQGSGSPPVQPMEVLAQYRYLLPSRGRALDMACGLGGNARLLLQQGLQVTAWDLSAVAIAALRDSGLEMELAVRDLRSDPPTAASFDVICVGHFLERGLCPAIEAALRPGGLLFYQSWCQDKVSTAGPTSPHFLLATNELLRLFPNLTLRIYREEGQVGDGAQGFRGRAMMVAQRL